MADFTTTTDTDRIVFAVLMMGTLKKYFNYGLQLECGLPAVTLLGERQDWEKLASGIDKLCSFGPVASGWHALLKPVLNRFVESFARPDAESTHDLMEPYRRRPPPRERAGLPLRLDHRFLLL